tara:strand:+ start:617 stop:1009 length:393 start_codon:yes stop_codon:yes gene_type:complete
MFKTLLVSGAAVSAAVLASPAFAGPFVNVENNAAFVGGDGLNSKYAGSVTDVHVGIDGNGDYTSWYMQAGPALISPQNGDADVELSGKIGGSVVVTADEKLSLYGEISFITVDDFDRANLGTKLGAKYNF